MSRYYNDSEYKNPTCIEEQKELHRTLNRRFDGLLKSGAAQMKQFWASRLRDVSGVDLAFLSNKILSVAAGNTISEINFSFQNADLLKVKQLTRSYKLTPYLFGQIVLGIVLHRLSGQDSIGIAFPVSIIEGRELIYGAHINTVFADYLFNTETTLYDIIGKTLDFFNELKAAKGKYLPVNEIIDQAANRNLLNVVFAQTNLRSIPIDFTGIGDAQIVNDMHIDLSSKLSLEQEVLDNQLNYRVRFDKSVLDQHLVQGLADLYQKLFTEILADLLTGNTTKQISSYQLLTKAAYQEIVYDWNETEAEYPSESTVVDLFELQVAKNSPSNRIGL